MRYYLLVIIAIISCGSSAHPLHMSVSNVTVTDTEIQLQIKCEAHDLAHELNALNHLDQKADYYYKNLKNDSLLHKHVLKSFTIKFNDTEMLISNISIQLIDGHFIVKGRIEIASEVKSLKVKNTLLHRTYHDQKNLVIVNYKTFEKGLELTVNNPEERIVFN